MKCVNCGAELPDGSTVCFECGAPQNAPAPAQETPVTPAPAPAPAQEKKKCTSCGAELPDGATVCFECGAPQNVAAAPAGNAQRPVAPVYAKSKVVAALLAFFFGCYGVDQFYLGYMKKGVLRIVLTFVTFGVASVIWGIIDCVRILVGQITVDAKGNPLI